MENAKNKFLIIPYDKLEPETLRALVEDVVGREGTDYGEIEFSFEEKVGQVMRQLASGKSLLTFDEASQTCNIVSKDDPKARKFLRESSVMP